MSFIDRYKKNIAALCMAHFVDKLYLFGSATNNSLTDASDVDLVVKFKHIEASHYFNNYSSFKSKLADLFRRKIDLLEEQTISNPYIKASIDNSKQLIYGQQD